MASLGSRDPALNKKKVLPDLMVLIGKPKGGAGPAGPPPDNGSPSTDDSPPQGGASPPGKAEAGKPPSPGKSSFHDQRETCSNCQWFDPAGNDNIGACEKGVPEADFTTSDPDSSWCRFHESGKDNEQAESPAEEASEVEPPNAGRVA